VHFDEGFARLSQCMLRGDAEFCESGGVDDVYPDSLKSREKGLRLGAGRIRMSR
jgi:hypothetical protein